MFFAASDFGESFILELAAMVIIIFLAARYAVPPIKAMMQKKTESIRGQLAAGDEARAATEQLLVVRRSELEAARAESKTIGEQAGRAAEQLVADAKRRGDEEYERLVAHAATQIELERSRMREEVASQMSSLVLSGAHLLVDAELSASRHRHLIDESIAAVETESRS